MIPHGTIIRWRGLRPQLGLFEPDGAHRKEHVPAAKVLSEQALDIPAREDLTQDPGTKLRSLVDQRQVDFPW